MRSVHLKRLTRVAFACAALAALRSQAAADESARTLRYVGTREIVKSADTRDPRVEPVDARYRVIDDVRWSSSGAYLDRADDLDYTPQKAASEPLNGLFGRTDIEVERRTESERRVPIGSHDVVEVSERSVTTDEPPAAEGTWNVIGISQDYLLTTVYARPVVTLAFSGRPFTFTNSTQRQSYKGAVGGTLITSVARDGAIAETSGGTARFTQAADGTAHFYAGTPGFSSDNLVVDAPVSVNGSRTIHSVRTTSGRTIGPYQPTVTDVTVPDWYPGGLPGSSDTLRIVGIVKMPDACGKPLGFGAGFESISTFSETRATGEVATRTVRSYTHGSTVLCSSIERRVRVFATKTGTLAQTSTDTETLHLTSLPPTVSVSLVADHEPSIGFGADRHAVGAHVLTIGVGEKKTVALRLSPASIGGDPDATPIVSPPLASASLGDQGSIDMEAGSAPGRAILTVRSPKAGGASASLPVLVYRRVDLVCEAGGNAVAFDASGDARYVDDPGRADLRIDCTSDVRIPTLFAPLGATAIHADVMDRDTFASVRPDQWRADAFSYDSTSAFAAYLRTPGNDHDEAQDILLVKTHAGEIVKILCARKAAFSLHGIYAVSRRGAFAY